MMEGVLIFIFAACLHFRQIPGKDVPMTSFLSSPGVLEPRHCLEPSSALWCDGAFPLGDGDWGNADQGRRLGWNALKDYRFLTGSLLLEQREKFGHNFMSSRTAFAVWIHEADLAPRADGRGLHLTQGFGVNTPGGSRVPSLSPFFVEEGGEKSVVFAADYSFWSVPSLFCLETEWIYLVST